MSYCIIWDKEISCSDVMNSLRLCAFECDFKKPLCSSIFSVVKKYQAKNLATFHL